VSATTGSFPPPSHLGPWVQSNLRAFRCARPACHTVRMSVIITGDRGWDCPELAGRVVGRLAARYGRENLIIVHGAARGVDAAFHHAATLARVDKDPCPAEWERLGRRVGPIRNAAMVAKGAVLCIAVHRFLAKSKGTKDCCLQALAAGIPVWLIDSDDGEPTRLQPDDPRLK
jgi:YspA, cpYpsA-related SLOG family